MIATMAVLGSIAANAVLPSNGATNGTSAEDNGSESPPYQPSSIPSPRQSDEPDEPDDDYSEMSFDHHFLPELRADLGNHIVLDREATMDLLLQRLRVVVTSDHDHLFTNLERYVPNPNPNPNPQPPQPPQPFIDLTISDDDSMPSLIPLHPPAPPVIDLTNDTDDDDDDDDDDDEDSMPDLISIDFGQFVIVEVD
jgi:hypothetical protein